MNINKYYIFEDEMWKHKPPLKLFVNPILRKLQFWTDKPLVIASITEFTEDGTPYFVRYKLKRLRYWKTKEELSE
jgi:hypothetical protein